MKKIEVKYSSSTGKKLSYGTRGSAAFDIENSTELKWLPEVRGSFYIAEFNTGLRFILPENHVLKIFPRSGFGFKFQMELVNTVGIIDSDYRGEVKVKLRVPLSVDRTQLPTEIGTRLVQGIIEELPKVNLNMVQEQYIKDDKTQRGEGGFGSTGEKSEN
jgi:dUTP pyrophosphatase